MLRIGMIAGEISGDTLGAGLMHALKQRSDQIEFEGIGGDKMIGEGFRSHFPMERLSVMGITEVLGRYLELRKIRTTILDYFLTRPPDVFIGIDAPDFNFWLEKKMREAGIKTVHYVSPSVWAWREYRINKIRRSIDLMLTLFPFESDYYSKKDIPNRYVGHPLAKDLVDNYPQQTARAALFLPKDKTIIALLPGSRLSEINKLTDTMLDVAKQLNNNNRNLHFVCGLANGKTAEVFTDLYQPYASALNVDIHIGKTHQLMAASDIILLASGTATLEAMLLNKPMVVTYRLSWLTYWIVKALAKIRYAALPNILAKNAVVAECLQADCNTEKISREMQLLLDSEEKRLQIKHTFTVISKELNIDANANAANAILELLGGVSVG